MLVALFFKIHSDVFFAKITISFSGAFIFFTVCIFGTFQFFLTARKWKSVINVWYEQEQVFLFVPYKTTRVPLVKKIRVTAFIIFFLSLGGYFYFRYFWIFTIIVFLLL
jgi:hypothetical protein